MRLVGLVATSALSACASVGATLDGVSTPTCDAARAMGLSAFAGQGERFASDAAMTAAYPNDDVTAVCADDDELCQQGAMWVFFTDPDVEDEGPGLQVTAGSGRVRYPELFESLAPSECVYDKLPRVIWTRAWAAVRVHSALSPGPNCAEATLWTQFALVARDSGTIAITGRCEDPEAMIEALPDGERVRVLCRGREAVLPISGVAACGR